jgi:3-oxoacyl-[acyl-carrier-protein] synthase I
VSAVSIVGAGACTPLGRSLPASAAAVEAGIRGGVGEHPFLAHRVGRRVKMALASWLDIRVHGADRFVVLAHEAAAEALAPLAALEEEPARLQVFVGLPESSRVGLPDDLEAAMEDAWGEDVDALTLLLAGHAAATFAIERAARARSGRVWRLWTMVSP